jgi:OmpA family/NAD(P)-binding Rossmann-like domain
MRRRHREPDPQLPVVTVLGGGIAGLTAAHELVERGFTVQLVEARESQSEEYACEIGGLAANQLSRVRAAIATLHPWLDPSSQLPPWDPASAAPPACLHRAANLQRVERFRDQALTETLTRFPVVETIVFDKQAYTGSHSAQPIDVVSAIYDYLEPSPLEQGLSTEKEGYVPIQIPFPPVTIEIPAVTREVPADWQQYWDRHGVFNALKLARVLDVIRRASLFYLVKYFPKLAERLKTGPDLSDDEWLSGTFTPIKLTVPVDNKGNPIPGASAILVQIVKQFVARESFLVQIVGYTDTDGTPEQNRAVANQWAEWVKEALVKLHAAQPSDLSVWDLEDRLDIVVVGGANPRYDQSTPLGRALSNRVDSRSSSRSSPANTDSGSFLRFIATCSTRCEERRSSTRAAGYTAPRSTSWFPPRIRSLE